MSLQFIVDGPPRPWQRAVVGKGGKIFTPKITRGYEKRVRACAATAILLARAKSVNPWDALTTGDVAVTLEVFFPERRRRRDLDNIVKSCLDGMSKAVYKDDSQVREIHAYASIDATRPRVEFSIRILEPST